MDEEARKRQYAGLIPYKKGHTGRPKGIISGRAKAIKMIDDLLGNEKNMKLLMEDMQKHFENAPSAFFFKYIVDLIPKEMILKHVGDNQPGGIQFTIKQVVREVVIEDGEVISVTELPVEGVQQSSKMIDQDGDNGKAE